MSQPRFLVTAASGQLGRLVVQELLRHVPAGQIAVAVRRPETVADFAAAGVAVRQADYLDPGSLDRALAGIERVLLISSDAVGARAGQHRNVVEAAVRAGVDLLAYTSVLHADRSPLALAADHRDTEAALRESGLPHVLLRNGWYTENLTANLARELAAGTRAGSAGTGRFSSAAREDYAEAAARILVADGQAGRIHELAGDQGYTLAEYAAELSALSGKPVRYEDLPEAAFRQHLLDAGLLAPFAALLADSDAAAAQGALYDDGRALSRWLGRPSTPLASSLRQALAAMQGSDAA